jgi:dephospho-CoA kinase
MMQVGITGGIGSGKSTVCKIFACLGIPILDTDTLAKNIINANIDLQHEIQQHFGQDIFANQILNKKLLALRAFDTKQNTDLLNSIVHPYVFDAINSWHKKQNNIYTIRESALIIETGSYKKLDVVIGISAPDSLRIQRLLDRNISETIITIQARMDKQMPDIQKQQFYNYTIINDGEQLLIPQVLHVHQQILKQL